MPLTIDCVSAAWVKGIPQISVCLKESAVWTTVRKHIIDCYIGTKETTYQQNHQQDTIALELWQGNKLNLPGHLPAFPVVCSERKR